MIGGSSREDPPSWMDPRSPDGIGPAASARAVAVVPDTGSQNPASGPDARETDGRPLILARDVNAQVVAAVIACFCSVTAPLLSKRYAVQVPADTARERCQ